MTDTIKAVTSLYNLALKGTYTVNVEGAQQILDTLKGGREALQNLIEENKNESSTNDSE